jgi:hypothetical protein
LRHIIFFLCCFSIDIIMLAVAPQIMKVSAKAPKTRWETPMLVDKRSSFEVSAYAAAI